MLKNMKLSTKILMQGIIIIACFSLLLAGVYPKVKSNMYDAKYVKTRNLVEAACGVVNYYVKQAKSNAMTLEEAQKRAKEAVKNMRYEQEDYFWINDLNAYMIAHPISPEKENTDWSDVKDPAGKRIVLAFNDVCRKDGAGFVEYIWDKPGFSKPVPKISYVKLIPEWGWVVGSGIYLDDVQKELSQLFMGIFGIAAVIIIGSLIFAFYIARSISKPLFATAQSLNQSAVQVASAAQQLSSTSQQLAEGSSEQAASIQETSSTLEESSSMVQQNSENTKQAAILAGQTKSSADKGNAEMQEMMESMDEIKKSSDQIAKIIKVIDDIAFQTNILALNAAVEAARAGDAGMGFAVVAEEVRNLAQRSAQAAKDTASIIERNIELSEKGVNVAKLVGESLGEITLQAKKVNELMDEISVASQEQTQGIMQINKAVGQMEKITQQSAANAEESASASEELTAQAENMEEVVEQLMKLVTGKIQAQNDKQINNRLRKENSSGSIGGHAAARPAKESLGRLSNGSITKRSAGKTKIVEPEDIIPLEDDMQDF